jgi:hypothetical protein
VEVEVFGGYIERPLGLNFCAFVRFGLRKKIGIGAEGLPIQQAFSPSSQLIQSD